MATFINTLSTLLIACCIMTCIDQAMSAPTTQRRSIKLYSSLNGRYVRAIQTDVEVTADGFRSKYIPQKKMTIIIHACLWLLFTVTFLTTDEAEEFYETYGVNDKVSFESKANAGYFIVMNNDDGSYSLSNDFTGKTKDLTIEIVSGGIKLSAHSPVLSKTCYLAFNDPDGEQLPFEDRCSPKVVTHDGVTLLKL